MPGDLGQGHQTTSSPSPPAVLWSTHKQIIRSRSSSRSSVPTRVSSPSSMTVAVRSSLHSLDKRVSSNRKRLGITKSPVRKIRPNRTPSQIESLAALKYTCTALRRVLFVLRSCGATVAANLQFVILTTTEKFARKDIASRVVNWYSKLFECLVIAKTNEKKKQEKSKPHNHTHATHRISLLFSFILIFSRSLDLLFLFSCLLLIS